MQGRRCGVESRAVLATTRGLDKGQVVVDTLRLVFCGAVRSRRLQVFKGGQVAGAELASDLGLDLGFKRAVVDDHMHKHAALTFVESGLHDGPKHLVFGVLGRYELPLWRVVAQDGLSNQSVDGRAQGFGRNERLEAVFRVGHRAFNGGLAPDVQKSVLILFLALDLERLVEDCVPFDRHSASALFGAAAPSRLAGFAGVLGVAPGFTGGFIAASFACF